MRRLAVPVALGLATVVLVGCGGGGGATTAAAPGREEAVYLQRVRALIDPPTELAGLVSTQLGEQPGPVPADSLLDALLDRTRRALLDLRALPLVSRVLVLQRNRLVAAFPAIIGQMRRLVDDLERNDRRALRADALPLARSLKGLPSALAGRSSSR
jgi:hypothetical protein